MAIKIDSNTPNDVVWRVNNTDHVVTAIQYDSTWVYARKGVYVTGTLPAYVTNLTATYTKSTYEPTDSNQSPLNNNGVVYHGGTVSLYPTPATYWTVTSPVSATVDFLTTTTFTGADHIQLPTRKLRNLTVTKNSNISSVTATYVNSSGVITYASPSSGSALNQSWSGGTVTWAASAATYWTCTASGTIAPANNTTAVTVSPTASRKLRNVVVTQNSNVSAITTTYVNSSGTTTSVTTGGAYSSWSGGTVTWAASAATYWTLSTSSGTIAPADNTSAVSVNPTPTRAERSVTVTKNSNIDSILVEYHNTTAGARTSTIASASGSIPLVWQGAGITWTPSAATYWIASGSSAAAGTSAVSISPTATREMRTITFTKNTHIESVSILYTNSSGVSTRTTRTSTGTVSAWEGATVTWTATAETGYTANPSSGTFAIGSGAQTIAPTASLALSWQNFPSFSATSISWTASNWNNATSSHTKEFIPDFLAPQTGVRISGSITILGTTKSFSNIELSPDGSWNTDVSVNVTVAGTSDTYVLHASRRRSWDGILFYLTCNGTLGKTAVSLSVTSLQIYAYDSSITLSAPTVSSDDYYVRVTNPNNVAVYIYAEGYIYWASTQVSTSSGDYTWLQSIASANNYYDVGSEDLHGDVDESLDSASARIALAADHYLNPSPSTSFEL